MRKPRKPRKMQINPWVEVGCSNMLVDRGIWVGRAYINPKQARRVAAWLLKAADWLEGEK